jgi:hypothetical protein
MIKVAATSFLALAELSKYAMFSFDIELSPFTYTNPAFREYITLEDDSLASSMSPLRKKVIVF